jgi:beta-lactamase regulating signal transducer with metallopeptidase domain/ketosteroid isomerase-like protein
MGSFIDYSNLLTVSINWFEFILDVTIKGSIILGIALLVTFFGKRSSACVRHVILYVAIISLLLLPVLSIVLPNWDLSFLQASSWQQNTSLLYDTVNTSQDISSNNNSGLPIPKIHWQVGLMALWAVGVLLMSARFITGLAGRWWILKKALPVTDPMILNSFSDYLKKSDLNRPIRLLQSSRVNIPLTWGYWNPTIVLPGSVNTWSDKRKEIVLLHEFAHIQRGDAVSTVIAQLVSVVYWFNPLVWAALRRFYLEREHASDNVVLIKGTKASDYAHHLLEIAKSLTTIRWSSPVEVAMAQKSYLEGRLLSILNNKENRKTLRLSTFLLICLMSLPIVLPLASMQTWAKAEIEKTDPKTDLKLIEKVHYEYGKAFEAQDYEKLMYFYSTDFFKQYDSNPKKGRDMFKKKTYELYFKKWKESCLEYKILDMTKEKNYYILYQLVSQCGIDEKGKKVYLTKDMKQLVYYVNENGKWKIGKIIKK